VVCVRACSMSTQDALKAGDKFDSKTPKPQNPKTPKPLDK
jgi:hypothetical protein